MIRVCQLDDIKQLRAASEPRQSGYIHWGHFGGGIQSHRRSVGHSRNSNGNYAENDDYTQS